MNLALRHGVGFLLLAWLWAVAPGCLAPNAGSADGSGEPVFLLDLSGRRIEPLEESEAAATVFLFLRTDCPISNRYAPEIRRLHDRFAPSGVKFWMVYPDPGEPLQAIRQHLADFEYPGRAARDPEHALVEKTQATVTPEAAVFVDGELVYRGRIDNRFVDFGKTRAAATTHDLAGALEAILDGRPVPESRTRAVGCFIPDRK